MLQFTQMNILFQSRNSISTSQELRAPSMEIFYRIGLIVLGIGKMHDYHNLIALYILIFKLFQAKFDNVEFIVKCNSKDRIKFFLILLQHHPSLFTNDKLSWSTKNKNREMQHCFLFLHEMPTQLTHCHDNMKRLRCFCINLKKMAHIHHLLHIQRSHEMG